MHEAAFHRADKALPMGEEEATEESAPAPAAPNEATETEIEAGAAAEPPSDPAPNEWSCPFGTPNPMNVPADAGMFFAVGPGLSE